MRWTWLFAPSLLLFVFAWPQAPAPLPTTVVEGTVTGADGTPLPGSMVTARAPDGTTVSTLADVEGRYTLRLPDGVSYRLHARRTGLEASPPASYDATADTTLHFVLDRPADVFEQAPSSRFLALLPDGETKRQFILDCTGCHQFDKRLITSDGRLKSRDTWHERITQMLSFAGATTGFPIMAPSREADATANWLVAHLGGPDDPLPVVEPLSAHAPGDAVRITEYPIPVPTDLPHDLALLPDGRVLITGMMTHQMYTLDPTAATFTTHPIPVPYANPRALTVDPSGTWWVLLGFPRKIAAYDPAADAWTDFDIGMYPHSIVRDDAGRIWFNGHFTKNPEQIGVLDPSTGAVTTYDVPAPPMPDGGSTIPYGLRLGPDGVLWGTQLVGNRLVRFDPATETFHLYDLPTTHSGPRRPAVGPDGVVWIPEYAGNKLARFDPATETFREYDLPVADALPYVVRVDARTGHVWIATAAADAVLRFDPAAETFAVYPLPTHRALVRHMEIDPATGDVWVAYGNSPATSPKIARLTVEHAVR